jgi:uncharacterized protein with von Willebrand factor type A (vWA) domain
VVLLRNVLHFAWLLRSVGLEVHTGRLLDVVRGIEHVGLGSREDFRHTLRTILVHRHEDFERFDQTFDLFWRRHSRAGGLTELHALGEAPRQVSVRTARGPLETIGPTGGSSAEPPERLTGTVRTWSPEDVRRSKDFGRFTADEIEEARVLLQGLRWRVTVRRTRRWSAGGGRSIDLRRVVRRNMKHGGELLDLPRRRRKEKMRPLVLVCDISGSMERYSRMLLHFAYALTRSRARVEAFLFATRLTRITRHLIRKRAADAVAAVSRAVPDWSGGTRIGEAMRTFNRQWGRRVLGHGPVVMLISDGWDRGDPDLLRSEMARLQRSCHRLIWLNPLLGSPAYEPLTRGMQAALAHVDDFLPAHNLASLEALAAHLGSLRTARGSRAGPWKHGVKAQ